MGFFLIQKVLTGPKGRILIFSGATGSPKPSVGFGEMDLPFYFPVFLPLFPPLDCAPNRQKDMIFLVHCRRSLN